MVKGLRTTQTSNYARAGSLPNAVATSQGIPKWFRGRVYKRLAPSWALVHVKDREEYTRRYRREVLAKLDPWQVYQDLGPDAILLCWEAPGEFCHRRLVAEWLEEHLGIQVPEMTGAPHEPQQQGAKQLGLI